MIRYVHLLFAFFLPGYLLAQTRLLDDDCSNEASLEYIVFSRTIQCQPFQDVLVSVECRSESDPPATIGALLHPQGSKGLRSKAIPSQESWLSAAGKENFIVALFHFPAASLTAEGAYSLSLYRSNQKGELLLGKISVRQFPNQAAIEFYYENTPDIVSPLSSGPSGVPDYYIRLNRVNAAKGIRELEITNTTGGRWVSGPDVKKNFWYIEYYDQADFPARISPRNNLQGEVHRGLSRLDVLFESVGVAPLGVTYHCTVHYDDGTKDTWSICPGQPEPAPAPLPPRQHSKKLVARQDYQTPALWTLPYIGERTYWTTMDTPEVFSIDMASGSGEQLHRVWSPAWFFPLTERRRKVNAREMQDLGIPLVVQVALREFQVFDRNGQEISREARIDAFSPQGIKHPERLTDGDLAAEKACTSLSPVLDGVQEAWFELNFAAEFELKEAVLHHGCNNGTALAWTNSHFHLESWDNNQWQEIPGSKTLDNRQEVTKHSLEGLETARLRLKIRTESGLYDYGRFDFGLHNPLLEIGKTAKIPANRPFFYWYLGHDGFINHALPDGWQADLNQYRQWRQKHPLFLGFQLVEFDSDLCDFLGWHEKRKFSAKKVFAEASKTLLINQELPPPPSTRGQAVEQIESVFRRYQALLFNEASYFTSATIWCHHGLEWGAVNTLTEKADAMAFAAARGASRQYGGKPWGAYYETFSGGGWTNYLESGGSAGYQHGPDCGKSASLYRRRLFLGYLMGVAFVDYEHSHLVLCAEKPEPGKAVKLSPHGEAAREVWDFDQQHPDRGVPYAPAALLLDWAHGWSSSENSKIFQGHFAPEPADRHLDAWMNGIFRPQEISREGYGHFMSQTGYSGLFDILVMNPPSGPPQNLHDYKVAVLAGQINLDQQCVDLLHDYVRKGGTLLLDASLYASAFPEDFLGLTTGPFRECSQPVCYWPDAEALPGEPLSCMLADVRLSGAEILLATQDGKPLVTRQRFGQGHVVVTLQKYLVEEPAINAPKKGLSTVACLLSWLRQELLPFTLEGNRPAEITVSRLSHGWRLGMINNQGVYKNGREKAVVAKDESAWQKIHFPGPLTSVRELLSQREIPLQRDKRGTSFEITVPPGAVAILELIE